MDRFKSVETGELAFDGCTHNLMCFPSLFCHTHLIFFSLLFPICSFLFTFVLGASHNHSLLWLLGYSLLLFTGNLYWVYANHDVLGILVNYQPWCGSFTRMLSTQPWSAYIDNQTKMGLQNQHRRMGTKMSAPDGNCLPSSSILRPADSNVVSQ